MGIALSVIVFLLVLTLIWGIIIYNDLVRLKHNVLQAWSNIEVLLRQRHDELPKLVETARQYMHYERDTLERVMAARAAVNSAQQRGDIGALGGAEQNLRLGLGNLFAVAEAYPELKADETFQHLQQRITGLENTIADRREFYNAAVNTNNIRIEQFPDVMIAQLFGFRAVRLLEFDRQVTKDVDMKTLFG
ncbi:MAG TPA: LemA family protein [Guyparkeria sp.]|nr:LemA family protein [Guyparkeria sp.]